MPSSYFFALSCFKRLQKELMALMMSTEKSISAFPEDSNLFRWKVSEKCVKTSYKASISNTLKKGNNHRTQGDRL